MISGYTYVPDLQTKMKGQVHYMNKRSKFSLRNEESGKTLLVRSTLIGAVCAIICSIFLILTLSAVILQTPDPDSLTSAAAYASTAVSLIISGIVSVRLSGGNITACALAGGIYTLICLCIHLSISGSAGGLTTLIFLALPVISTLVGLIARPREKKRGPKIRKRYPLL